MVARWRHTRLTTRTPTVARMSAKMSAVSPVAAASASAGNGSAKLTPLERRLALLHEGAAAFDIVLRIEALLHQPGQAGEVGLAVEPRQLLDGALGGMHGERRILADHLAVVVDIGIEFRVRHDAGDQSHAERLLGGEVPRREENLLGMRRADQIRQDLQAAGAIAETETRRRHAELADVRGDADVAEQRYRQSAADAVAADAGDRRFGALVEARVGDLTDLVVVGDLLGRVARLLELRDVGARDKSLVAGASDHDDTDRRVLLKLVEDDRDRLPHVGRGGVVLLRLVEDEPADRARLLRDHVGGRAEVGHQITPRLRKPSIAAGS